MSVPCKLISRKPVELAAGLPGVDKNWERLLRNNEHTFLTDNQLSVFINKNIPGCERMHFYPLPFAHSFKEGKWSFGELAQHDSIRISGPTLDFAPQKTRLEYLPHVVRKKMKSGTRSIDERSAVSGNTFVAEWKCKNLNTLTVALSLPYLKAQAKKTDTGLIVSIRDQAFVVVALAGAKLLSVEIAENEPLCAKIQFRISGSAAVRLAMSFGYNRATVSKAASTALRHPAAFFASIRKKWDDYFTKVVPHFSCSDTMLEKLYYYQTGVTRMNRYDIPYEPFTHPYTCPWKTGAVWQWTWNTPVAAIQERWLNDKGIGAGGILLQADNGGALGLGSYLRPVKKQTAFRSHNEQMSAQTEYRIKGLPAKFDFDALTTMAHTTPNGLLGAWEFYLATGDKDFLKKALAVMLDAYARFSEHELENGLCTCMFVDDFDFSLRWKPFSGNYKPLSYEWELDTPVIAIDYNCYLHSLVERIILAAREINADRIDIAKLQLRNERLKTAVNRYLWDDNAGFYFDADPRTMRRSNVKCIAAFSSLYAGIADEKQAARLVKHLTDPREFGTPYPCPSVSKDTPGFDPSRPSLGGDCMTTTGLWFTIEGLFKFGYCDLAVKYLLKALEMMTKDGRITSADTFNSITGESNRRDNYENTELAQQGLITIDLICKYIIGIVPKQGGAFEVNPAALADSRIRSFIFGPYDFCGRLLSVKYDKIHGYRIQINRKNK